MASRSASPSTRLSGRRTKAPFAPHLYEISEKIIATHRYAGRRPNLRHGGRMGLVRGGAQGLETGWSWLRALPRLAAGVVGAAAYLGPRPAGRANRKTRAAGAGGRSSSNRISPSK